MTQSVVLKKSTRPTKKYMAVIPFANKEYTIHFGQAGAEDYTIHKDKERLNSYIRRHAAMDQDWEDIFTPGFWAKHLLWNKPSIEESMKDIEKRYKVSIVNRI